MVVSYFFRQTHEIRQGLTFVIFRELGKNLQAFYYQLLRILSIFSVLYLIDQPAKVIDCQFWCDVQSKIRLWSQFMEVLVSVMWCTDIAFPPSFNKHKQLFIVSLNIYTPAHIFSINIKNWLNDFHLTGSRIDYVYCSW
jgi:hypothetical protein